ncbi:MAG: zinc-dependent alcohol dehydrogenase family protein [Candidatus Dormibacterales bacterium]
MRAVVLEAAGAPLRLLERPDPSPGPGHVLVEVSACAVCRTDLHLVDGELPGARLPLVPGHQAIGRVRAAGPGADRFRLGDRVGIPWLAWTCGECLQCRAGRENLCERARFTGYDVDGGFAELAVADERYCLVPPAGYPDERAAPLLCAGVIGARALRMCGDAGRLGLYGFGAAAHIVVQVALREGRTVFAFTRPEDAEGRGFARAMGASWAGGSDTAPPEALDAAIIFAPVGPLVPAALAAVRPGGTVVCAGIHMSDIPALRYSLLWGERVLRSVANLTREDGEAFMRTADGGWIRTEVEVAPLERAGSALERLREGGIRGAAVLTTGAGPA